MEKNETQIEKKQDGLPEEIISQAYFCLECGRCTGTCPMAELFPDQFHPRKILLNFLLATDVDYSAADLWLCASCYKCNKRCPQAIELPGIFVGMRKLALEKGGIS
jgi:heterodisulfide reductase subunit C